MVDTNNPYVAPTESNDTRDAADKPLSYLNALTRWSLICLVSAGPSFYLGLFTVADVRIGIPVMLAGIAFFAIGYAFVDIGPVWRSWMRDAVLRRCIIGAYFFRVVLSIFFPAGMVHDMCVGMISMNVVGFAFGFAAAGPPPQISNILQILLTTIMQGVLLNLEVFALIVLLVASVHAFRAIYNATRRDTP